MIHRVRIARDTSAPLWCIWAVGWPRGLMTDKEFAHPAADYLGGYLRIEDARASAQRAGWVVDE